MALYTVIELFVLVTPNLAGQMCKTLDRLKEVKENKILIGSQITNLTMPGIMTCSRACLYRRTCNSFNFNTETGECQLNSGTMDSDASKVEDKSNFVFSDISHWPQRLAGACTNHTCPLNSYCDPVNITEYMCIPFGCRGVPTITNGQVNEIHASENESPIGSTLFYTCKPVYIPKGKLVCQEGGTWSSPVCMRPSSCSMVKHYHPDSEDGEYWLRLNNFDNYKTKIYCHNMATWPKEFLTLPIINYGIYPKVMRRNCLLGETELGGDCKGQGGEIWFRKIRVNITTMEVVQWDRTFAYVTSNESRLTYGGAYDCYTAHPNKWLTCGTKGGFNIYLRGTGWRVSEEQQWEVHGWKPVIESIDRQMNGTVIKLHCGGFGGGCRPTGGLFLKPLHD